jgi:hypothetical protein
MSELDEINKDFEALKQKCKVTDGKIECIRELENSEDNTRYSYLVIDTYRTNEERIRQFFDVSDLRVFVKHDNAPAFNVNSFEYSGMDGKRYRMDKIIGEIIEQVRVSSTSGEE